MYMRGIVAHLGVGIIFYGILGEFSSSSCIKDNVVQDVYWQQLVPSMKMVS